MPPQVSLTSTNLHTQTPNEEGAQALPQSAMSEYHHQNPKLNTGSGFYYSVFPVASPPPALEQAFSKPGEVVLEPSAHEHYLPCDVAAVVPQWQPPLDASIQHNSTSRSQNSNISSPNYPYFPAQPDMANLNAYEQWSTNPSTSNHEQQGLPIAEVAPVMNDTSLAHQSYRPNAYESSSTGLGEQQSDSAQIIMPNGNRFSVPEEIATLALLATSARCGSYGTRHA